MRISGNSELHAFCSPEILVPSDQVILPHTIRDVHGYQLLVPGRSNSKTL